MWGSFGNYALGASAVAIAAILALTTAIRPRPWYDARYAIPLSGGSGLAAVAVVYLAAMWPTDHRQRIRIDRLTATARGPRP